MLKQLFLILFLIPSVALAVMKNQKAMVTAGDMSSSITATEMDVGGYLTISCQADWTGSTPTGTFKMQLSNDTGNAPGNWTDYSATSYAITANGDYAWNFANVGFRWLRLVYTRASGTGTLNSVCTLKGT